MLVAAANSDAMSFTVFRKLVKNFMLFFYRVQLSTAMQSATLIEQFCISPTPTHVSTVLKRLKRSSRNHRCMVQSLGALVFRSWWNYNGVTPNEGTKCKRDRKNQRFLKDDQKSLAILLIILNFERRSKKISRTVSVWLAVILLHLFSHVNHTRNLPPACQMVI